MKNFTTLLSLFFVIFTSFSQEPTYSWRYYRPGNTGIQGDYCTALWIDGNGDPYIAANTGNWGEGGFARFNQADNTWTNYSNVDNQILGSFDNGDVQLFDIVQDYQGYLWMGNFTGALKFSPEQGISSTQRYTSGNSALQGFTYDIDIAPDSTVWFTSGGMVRYDLQLDEWSYWDGASARIAVQPKPDGSYVVWSADTYYGYVFTYNSATNDTSVYMPSVLGEVAGLPGKDCVDDAGNFWALRMSVDGNWETLEYQRTDGTWVYPAPPYENVSYYIDAFKAYGDTKALLVTESGETWMFDGTAWQNYGVWRPDQFTYAVEADQQGNVWVCGVGGAAKRDVQTGNWQRYRITNTSQIDYFVEDLSIDSDGNVWMTGNAGSGYGGFQYFDQSRWTGFNNYTYGLGYPFPYDADNTQAIFSRPSNGDVVFNPTFHGIHAWNGTNYYPLEDLGTTSQAFEEDSQGRLWTLEEYGGLRHYDEGTQQWISEDLGGWGTLIHKDSDLPGTVWAATDYTVKRTDGTNFFTRTIEDFPGGGAWLTGLAVEPGEIVWIATWSQFTSTGSTLIRLDANTGEYQTWSHDEGWPFPGEHVRPMTYTADGRLWMQYDSEYPSTDAGLLWWDGVNMEIFPSAPGGIPQWGGLPNSTFLKIRVKYIPGGYELWMSCLGRGIAVLTVINDPTGITETKTVDSSIQLGANPNPFHTSSELNFSIPEKDKVTIKLYDLNGRELKTLADGSYPAGKHSVTLNAITAKGNALMPGMYICRLTSGRQEKSVKIIVK